VEQNTVKPKSGSLARKAVQAIAVHRELNNCVVTL